MATKPAGDPDDVEDLLDSVDKTLERLRSMYEQYFLGIQKQAPTFIHNDVERKLRDLTQMQLRNTGLRYRLATLTQKFGSYNSYWRRTLRQIEQGTYFRNLSKVGRDAIRTGANIPEEILAAMPKRMREQVVRDREQALAIARRHDAASADEELELAPEASDDVIAMIKEPTELRRNLRTVGGAHILQEDDGEIDLAAFFASVEEEKEVPAPPKQAAPLRAASITTPPAMRAGRSTASPIQTQTQPRQPVQTQTQPRQTGPVQTQTPPSTRTTGPMQAVAPPTRATGPVQTQTPPSTRTTGPMQAVAPPTRATGPVQTVTPPSTRTTGPVQTQTPPSTVGLARPAASPNAVPSTRATGPMQAVTPPRQTGSVPVVPAPAAAPRVPSPAQRPLVPAPAVGGGVPKPIAATPSGATKAASQVTRPTPIVPGAAAAKGAVPVESMSGPFPRAQTPPSGMPVTKPIPKPVPSVATQPYPQPKPAAPKPAAAAPMKPPPGMSDADVNALYAKYVKAKEMVGEKVGPGEHNKLLKTINAQAPKIMEQYKAKAVDFSVVVKDNQVIIRAKPKT